jgi:hypothetical protein
MGFQTNQLHIKKNGISYRTVAYIVLGEHINLNHSPALYGNGFNPEEINQ